MVATTAPSSLIRTFSSSGVGRAACGARDKESAFPWRVPFWWRTVKSKLAIISSQQRIIAVGDSRDLIQVSALLSVCKIKGRCSK